MTAPVGDEEARSVAVRERTKNLVVTAGAGTGKTSLIVERLIEMIAPADDGPCRTLNRVAAITFTRRAAGELRTRIRKAVLESLSSQGKTPIRTERLHAALGALDTAFIGTIHSFADRLLRMLPVEARLSPSYEVVDDEDEDNLIQSAYRELVSLAEQGALTARMSGTPFADRATEVEETLRAVIAAGLRPQTSTSAFARIGLDRLMADMLRKRDLSPDVPAVSLDEASFRRAAGEYRRLTKNVDGSGRGEQWLLRFGAAVSAAEASLHIDDLFPLVGFLHGARKELRKTIHFETDIGREAWEALVDGLGNELTAPVRRWMATRLVRTFPIVNALYDDLKTSSGRVDGLDLLQRLVVLMRTNLDARRRYQALFDHVFVDEVQDTDPLQAELVLFLGEASARARTAADVVLAEGRLTLVGDPKQSIYRFRRADVATYDQLQTRVRSAPGTVSIKLQCNYRSTSPMVSWFNATFSSVLQTAQGAFDPKTGAVAYDSLEPSREAEGRAVQLLPFTLADDTSELAAELRRAEARAIASHVKKLVAERTVREADGESRPLRFADVAVLGLVTTQMSILFEAFDEASVPYTASGGTLFLEDPLHRQFLLGLRALADRDDGVAEAALMRPPFFAIDLWDWIQSRAPDPSSADVEAANRGTAARDLVRTLRRERFAGSPGRTARKLLDETNFGLAVAMGPNGEQRVRQLRELCTAIDLLATERGLDFDGVTALARDWIDWPVRMEAPRPLRGDAVQVMSVHQAKGLEFPVVVLWDACGEWRAADRAAAFMKDPRSGRWAVNIDGLEWTEPAGTDAVLSARSQADSERRRLVYVAATRARDLLVVPHGPGSKVDDPDRYIHAALARGGADYVERLEPRLADPASPPAPTVRVTVELADATLRTWQEASARAREPRYAPAPLGHPNGASRERVARMGRFGAVFGDVVHRSIGLVLRRNVLAQEAVARHARALGLHQNIEACEADVVRALETIQRAGFSPTSKLLLEYPVGIVEGGTVLTGYADLVALDGDDVAVIDFKTDHPPDVDARTSLPDYVAQVAGYARALSIARPSARMRSALLWTATGAIEWV